MLNRLFRKLGKMMCQHGYHKLGAVVEGPRYQPEPKFQLPYAPGVIHGMVDIGRQTCQRCPHSQDVFTREWNPDGNIDWKPLTSEERLFVKKYYRLLGEPKGNQIHL